MTKISNYSADEAITGGDKWIGSDEANGFATKNFTPNKLSEYFNTSYKLNAQDSLIYPYLPQSVGQNRRLRGISFNEGVDGLVLFQDVNYFIMGRETIQGIDVSEFAEFLTGTKCLIYNVNDVNEFFAFRVITVADQPMEPNFLRLTVEFLDGNGGFRIDQTYGISVKDLVGSGDVIDSGNRIVYSAGFTIVGSTFTLLSGWQWLIDNIGYTNLVDIEIEIPLASSGMQRLDRIVLDTLNSAVRVAGNESSTILVVPALPANTLQATVLLVDNTSIGLIDKEDVANKQNSLAVDGTGTKYPTVDAVNEAFDNLPPVNDATTTTKGILKLAGDLGGTADLPTVPELANKIDGSGTVNTVPLFTGLKTLGNSAITQSATGGRILLGATDNGVHKLQVNGLTLLNGGVDLNKNVLAFGNTNDAGHLIKYDATVDGLLFHGYTGFRFTNYLGEVMRCYGSRNLLIGTTTDNGVDKLQVNGSTNISTNLNVGGIIISRKIAGTSNMALGVTALNNFIGGASNIAVGQSALAALVTGDTNIAIGHRAFQATTSATQNTIIGYQSAISSNSGVVNNTFVGANTGYGLTSGSYNTAIGTQCLSGIVGGSYNIGVGQHAGGISNSTVYDNSIFIGYNTTPNATSQTNQIVIGHTAIGIGSNSVVLGNDSVTKTALKGNVLIGTTTDSGVANEKLQVNGTISANGAHIKIETNVQSGTTYTLVAADLGKQIVFTNSSAITVTIPSGLPTGFNCEVLQQGAGQVSFITSATILKYSTFELAEIEEQYGLVGIDKMDNLTETYHLYGELSSI